ncbi:head maturation protease, ClpP-related [Xenorhabdus bovienii]|uniref:head maturation protease, ClpP-related n=1 Tax=Xenorhabdus bovienii TaxID=40576 RepID=UPI00237D229F|nr:head maturation protease, ClpP-related [Xenorhabdus bovienii]MDE1476498.1 Clp protease ClpP [Xenorhabdus bovienii]MDE9463400.1 Clp protease ClpP [Xenorhabdus bovienii]MDE9471039.1 Clp protease ClpP [Xenorhabdus bovienii]
MIKNNMPAAPEGRPLNAAAHDIKPLALDKWNSGIKAASTENTISVLDVIGESFWDEGVTAKRISGALRAIGNQDVIVNINSPGGDVFEGIAIYNLLRNHGGKVTVNVLGLAASAASVIAMAGDEINMGRGAFLMIHNAWTYCCGNKNELMAVAEALKPFDDSLIDIYATRTGIDRAIITNMMDGETFINHTDAMAQGFADGLLTADVIDDGNDSPQAALRKLDALLAKSHVPRTERRKLFNALSGSTPRAASEPKGTPGAATEINPETLAELEKTINAFAPAHP